MDTSKVTKYVVGQNGGIATKNRNIGEGVGEEGGCMGEAGWGVTRVM